MGFVTLSRWKGAPSPRRSTTSQVPLRTTAHVWFQVSLPSCGELQPSGQVDDGTCQYEGCTNVNSVNFNPLASVDDGSCEILGCMEFAALNFDPTATLPGACAFCVGDLNFDGFVSLTDLFGLLEVFGTLCQ